MKTSETKVLELASDKEVEATLTLTSPHYKKSK